MQPFFTVIIPVYNCEKTIIHTLNSIVNQTFKNYEIIILDDCSTDNTLNIVKSFRSNFLEFKILVNDENIGVAKTRNIGFSEAKGHYIALIDGDDLWLPDKLEKQFQVIKKTECDICCSSYSFIDDKAIDIKKPYFIPEIIDYNSLLKENFIGCSSVVIKKSILNLNCMNYKFQHEDYALWLKLARGGAKIVGITEPLMKYRIQKNSRSFNKINAAKGRLNIYLKQENLGYIKSLYYFLCYIKNGLKKKLL